MVDIARELETLKKSGAPLPDSDVFRAGLESLPAFQGWSVPFYREDKETNTAFFYLCLLGWSEINFCYTMGQKDSQCNGWSFSGSYLQDDRYDRLAP